MRRKQIQEAAAISSGQTLIVRVSPDTEPETMEDVGSRLRECLPGVQVIVINCDQLLVAP